MNITLCTCLPMAEIKYILLPCIGHNVRIGIIHQQLCFSILNIYIICIVQCEGFETVQLGECSTILGAFTLNDIQVIYFILFTTLFHINMKFTILRTK